MYVSAFAHLSAHASQHTDRNQADRVRYLILRKRFADPTASAWFNTVNSALQQELMVTVSIRLADVGPETLSTWASTFERAQQAQKEFREQMVLNWLLVRTQDRCPARPLRMVLEYWRT